MDKRKRKGNAMNARLGAAILFAALMACPAFGEESGEITPADLVQRLEYACEMNMGWGVAECDEVKTYEPPAQSAESIEAQVQDYEAKLRADIAAGNVPDRWRRGPNPEDPLIPLDDPRMQARIEQQVRSMVESQRTALVDFSQPTEEKKRVTFYLAQDGRVRLESDYAYFKRGGAEDAQFAGRKEIVVLTPAFQKNYYPNSKMGMVYEGLEKNPRATIWDLGAPSPARAGAPASAIGKAENVVSTTAVATPEGEALKVVFRDACQKPGVGNVHVLWVLPEKGYRLFKKETYIHGRLVQTGEYDGYQEVQPGLWFPMHQVTQIVKAELPAEIEAALKAGSLDRASDQVFANQQIIERRKTERRFARALWREEVPDGMFDLQFPPGTRVYDYVLGADGRPLKYVVGDLVAGAEASGASGATGGLASASGTFSIPQ